LFRELDSMLYELLKGHLITAKLNVEMFNEVVSYRNNLVLTNLSYIKELNPAIFDIYHSAIIWPLNDLDKCLRENYKVLCE